MPTTTNRHTIPGSERTIMPGAKAVGDVTPDERFEVTVRLRSKAPLRSLANGDVYDDKQPAQRQYLSRDEYAAGHGADPQDIAKIAEFATAHHLAVVESNAARRSVVLCGTATTLSAAFGVTLQQFEHEGGTYRGRTGSISVPANLAEVVEGVFGLDDRPQASPHFQRLHPEGEIVSRAASTSPATGSGFEDEYRQRARRRPYTLPSTGHGKTRRNANIWTGPRHQDPHSMAAP